MGYPAGISLAVIEAGSASTYFGDDAKVEAKVTPVTPGTKHIVHQSTGHVLVGFTQTFKAEAGSVLSFSVPHVDQAGWTDGAGNAYTMWAYQVEITATVGGSGGPGQTLRWTKNVQPVVGQDFIDLDLVADGDIGEPVSAPLPTVTSVNGYTGAVIVSGDAATDEALAANLADAKSYADAQDLKSLRQRGTLAAGTDLNTLGSTNGPGMWALSSSGSYPNAPFAGSGMVYVITQGSTVEQTAIRYGSTTGRFTRALTNVTNNTWSPWTQAGMPLVLNVTSGTNLDDYRTSNDYVVQSASVAESLTGGWPDSLGIPRTAAYLSVRVTGPGLVFQRLQTYGADPRLLIRSSSSTQTTPFPFSVWVDTTAPDTTSTGEASTIGQHAGVANAVLLQDYTRRRPVVKTGGKAAVALRFDHGLANFRDLVLPELRRLGLPSALCLNAGDWSRTENGGATYADVNGWVVNDQVEIWNHALNHVDVTDPAEFETQIVTGLTELRSQLPDAVIDGFMPPGSGPYIDFNGGDTVESWWNTDAGRLILQHHAVATGYISGTAYRVLDGQPRQGQGHWTTDAMTVTSIIDKVTTAQNTTQGVQLMLHPSRLNTTGYITSADFTTALEHIAAERDAGRLVVLGAYDLLRADAS